MSDQMILKHCAPTLAGIKTGNLFSCAYESRSEIFAEIRRLNGLLAGKGVRVIPLLFQKHRVLIYLYRPSALRRDLNLPDAVRILASSGYPVQEGPACGEACRDFRESRQICRLCRRLRENPDFPHEIGLFLSYPAADVEGFTRNRGENYKLAGPWKVYGDVKKAARKFAQYRRCTESFLRQSREGKSLAELAVSNCC